MVKCFGNVLSFPSKIKKGTERQRQGGRVGGCGERREREHTVCV